jgi:hypothetical protein
VAGGWSSPFYRGQGGGGRQGRGCWEVTVSVNGLTPWMAGGGLWRGCKGEIKARK